jgi:hypothetical protein
MCPFQWPFTVVYIKHLIIIFFLLLANPHPTPQSHPLTGLHSQEMLKGQGRFGLALFVAVFAVPVQLQM